MIPDHGTVSRYTDRRFHCRCDECRIATTNFHLEKRTARRRLYKSGPCVDCGGTFPIECMDFDHVRGEKVAKLAAMFNATFPTEKIEAEIAKCDLVCANCHRIRTYQRSLKRRRGVKTR